MLRLDTTTRKLQLQLAGAVATNQLPVLVSYSDKTASNYNGATQVSNSNSATLVDICAAPAAATIRDIDAIFIWNRDTAAATIKLIFNDNGTAYQLTAVTLAVGDQFGYTHGEGWSVLDSTGSLKQSGASFLVSPAFTGNPTAPTPAQGDNDTSIATTAFVIGEENKHKNLMINGGCEVAQRAVPNLGASGVYVAATMVPYGQVDRAALWASGGAVSAGTLVQATNAVAGRTGKAARAAGVTLTGAGVISWRYRMEALDAIKYKNINASFSIKVAHDVGSNINYTAIIRKANAADDFSAVTVIATGSATAIATATGTTLKLENVAMGDTSNGIEVEVQAACGAVTIKNFDFTEWQLEPSAVATDFELVNYTDALAYCRRYLPAYTSSGTNEILPAIGYNNTTTGSDFTVQFLTESRAQVTGLVISAVGHFAVNDSLAQSNCTAIALGSAGKRSCRIGTTVASGLTVGRPCVLLFISTSGLLLFTGAEL